MVCWVEFVAMSMATRGKPFAKGDPRINKRGRGKGVVQISDLLRRIGQRKLPLNMTLKVQTALAMTDNELKRSKTMLEAVMEVVYWCALNGESWAVQFIAERTEGKVKDVLAIEPSDETVSKARKLLARL